MDIQAIFLGQKRKARQGLKEGVNVIMIAYGRYGTAILESSGIEEGVLCDLFSSGLFLVCWRIWVVINTTE
jgi:hypothetical protein